MKRPDLSRRNLLQGAGVVVGGAALGGCVGSEDPYRLVKPDVPGAGGFVYGEEHHVTSSCAQCDAGCAIDVRVVEGRAVKLEGHPEFPVNRGGLGPKGQAGLHTLYHADRIRTPLKREGSKSNGRLVEIGWDQAIDEIGAKLATLRESGHPEGLVVLDGEPRGPLHELWGRFATSYGTPNHVDHRSVRDGGQSLALELMQGHADIPAFDWERVHHVLGFGSSLFESWCQSIHMMRRPSEARATAGRGGMGGGRVTFTQVSPRHSVTSAKADEWIPIRESTYGALALGIAHVLLSEGLHDADFVREHTFGFEAWTDEQGREHGGFQQLVLERYAPDKVEDLTGVRAVTIRRLALELAGNGPGIAIADGTATSTTNGLWTAMAIHSLNALLGNLERPGGVLVPRRAPLAPWPDAELDDVARRGAAAPRLDGARSAACALGNSRIHALPSALLGGRPYPTEALFLYRSNPSYSKPEGMRWAEALRRIPLVVSFSPFEDESTRWADYVLPDHTYLERWEVVEPAPSLGVGAVGLRQPAVEPLFDTRATGDVVIQLAQSLGGSCAAAMPWKSWRSAGLARLRGLIGAENAAHEAASLGALGKALKKHGGWWGAEVVYEDWDAAFATPSGRFEFYSRELERRLGEAFPGEGELDRFLEESGVRARGDELCLPHFEPPRFVGEPADYPLVLLPYRPINHAEGGVRHLAVLRELPGAGRLDGWKEWIEISPRDARELGVHDGDEVQVESPAGSRRLHARIDAGTRPGTLGLPLGYGLWPAPDDEQTGGWGLVASASDPLAGILAIHGTRARVKGLTS